MKSGVAAAGGGFCFRPFSYLPVRAYARGPVCLPKRAPAPATRRPLEKHRARRADTHNKIIRGGGGGNNKNDTVVIINTETEVKRARAPPYATTLCVHYIVSRSVRTRANNIMSIDIYTDRTSVVHGTRWKTDARTIRPGRGYGITVLPDWPRNPRSMYRGRNVSGPSIVREYRCAELARRFRPASVRTNACFSI